MARSRGARARWLLAGLLPVLVAATFVTAAAAAASPPWQLNLDRPNPTAVAQPAAARDAGQSRPKPYASYTPYGRIVGILRGIERRSQRVTVQVIGHSAGGRPLYLATIEGPWASPQAKARYESFLRLMLSDPAAAGNMLHKGGDLRIPVFINCSIHGNEPTGVDAGLRLLRKLAFGHDAATRAILRNDVVLINVVQNPDGRVGNHRTNANGFDLNRDFIAQTQPEVRATVRQIIKWHPTVFCDLHGFYNPMAIDPSTAPHDPNYEWDLAIKWELPQAETMEKAIEAHTPIKVDIPYRDWIDPKTGISYGFEDYEPFYAPQFDMFYGLVAQTMETAHDSQAGVAAHYWGIFTAARFAAAHRVAMLSDQLARYERALAGQSEPATADVPHPITYPYAYVLPMDPAGQKDPLAARATVRRMVDDGIQVQRASQAFVAGGQSYAAGSYVVPLRQPLRGLANAMLWYGQNISGLTPAIYDMCAWNAPELNGFDRVAIADPFAAQVQAVTQANSADPPGAVTGDGPYFALSDTSINAVQAVTALLSRHVPVYIGAAGAVTPPVGTFVVRAATAAQRAALDAAAQKRGVDFTTIEVGGADMRALTLPKIAVINDTGVAFALRQLGFDAQRSQGQNYLKGFGVVLSGYGGDGDGIASFVNKGGTYVALGGYGVRKPYLLDVTPVIGSYWADNVIANLDLNDAQPECAGYQASDYVFAWEPTWFTGIGPDVQVDATYAGGDYILAGFWKGHPPATTPAGQPAIVSGSYGKGSVVYMGFTPAFRAQTPGAYRLLTNAIFDGTALPAGP